MAYRIALAGLIWTAILAIGNPFFEGRKRLIAMLCAMLITTAAFILGGPQP